MLWNYYKSEYNGYQTELANMVYKFLDKKTKLEEIKTRKMGASVNKQLAQELHKLVVKKLKKRESLCEVSR